MKKICFVDYDMSVIGGVEQVTAALVNALADKCEVHLLCFYEEKPLAYNLDPRVKYTRLFDQEYRLRDARKKAKDKLKSYFEENNIDVAILQGNYSGFLGSAVRFSTKTKLVFCDHGALMNQWERKDIVMIRLISSLLCNKVVTLTEENKVDYCKHFLLPKNKVRVIQNWIDLDKYHSQKYDTESKSLVSAGRFGKEKGFDQLIKAFAPVAKKHPQWTLDLYGDGEMMDTVKNLIDEYNIGGNVNLMGMRNDLSEQYGKYAFYVLPSYREGLPLTLLEAKTNRLPIVSFNIKTGPSEIVRDGVDGILVPPQDIEAMSNAICSIIEDDDMRIRMSDKSQENIDKFSKKTIINKWMSLIEEL